MIDSLGEIKEMKMTQLVHELRAKMDPDVAASATWYIKHAEHPKSWMRWYVMAAGMMTRCAVNQVPRKGFTPHVWDIIGEHYRACHLFGRKCRLL